MGEKKLMVALQLRTRLAKAIGIKTGGWRAYRKQVFLHTPRHDALKEFPELAPVFAVQDRALRFYQDGLLPTVSLTTNQRNLVRAKRVALEALTYLDKKEPIPPYQHQGRESEISQLRIQEMRALRAELAEAYENTARINSSLRRAVQERYIQFSQAYFTNPNEAVTQFSDLTAIRDLEQAARPYFTEALKANHVNPALKELIHRGLINLAMGLPLFYTDEIKAEAESLRNTAIGKASLQEKNNHDLPAQTLLYALPDLVKSTDELQYDWEMSEKNVRVQLSRIDSIDERIKREQWRTAFLTQPKEWVLNHFPELTRLYHKQEAAFSFYSQKYGQDYAEKAAYNLAVQDIDKLLAKDVLQAVSEMTIADHELIIDALDEEIAIERDNANGHLSSHQQFAKTHAQLEQYLPPETTVLSVNEAEVEAVQVLEQEATPTPVTGVELAKNEAELAPELILPNQSTQAEAVVVYPETINDLETVSPTNPLTTNPVNPAVATMNPPVNQPTIATDVASHSPTLPITPETSLSQPATPVVSLVSSQAIKDMLTSGRTDRLAASSVSPAQPPQARQLVVEPSQSLLLSDALSDAWCNTSWLMKSSPFSVAVNNQALRSTAPPLSLQQLFKPSPILTQRIEKKGKGNWNANVLTDALNLHVEKVACHLLGQPVAREADALRFGSNKGSIIVTLKGEKCGLWYDHQTGQGGNLLTLIEQVKGCQFTEALDIAGNFLGLQRPQPVLERIDLTDLPRELDEKAKNSVKYARSLAHQSLPINGTVAETYLQNRGIDASVCSDFVRFLPSVKEQETQQKHPALLLLAKNIAGKVQGVQAIFLTEEGKKLPCLQPKRSYGIIKGSAIPIHEGGNIYAVAEGAETALSVATACPELTVFASLGNLSNFSAIPFVAQNNTLIICADHDAPNPKPLKPNPLKPKKGLKINEVAEELTNKGFNLLGCQPAEEGKDFNDLLREQGIAAVQQTLKNVQLYQSPFQQPAQQIVIEEPYLEKKRDREVEMAC